MIERYAFYGQAEKLHYWYNGAESKVIESRFPVQYKKLVDIWVKAGYHPDVARLDVAGLIATADPALADYRDEYRAVSSAKLNKNIFKMLQEMTLPGIMNSIIGIAKTAPDNGRFMPSGNKSFAEWKRWFIRPTSEWYNPVFAKDLFRYKPEWCYYKLTDEEQKELLGYMLKKTGGKPPVGKDPWIVPPTSVWSKFNGTLDPLPSNAFKKHGQDEIIISYIKTQCKNGIRLNDKTRSWLSRHYKEVYDEFCKKYPQVLTPSKWQETVLTPEQQKRVDKWKQVADLVCNDLSDYDLVKKLTTKERELVGNHFKCLDQKLAFQVDKYKNEVTPIIEKLKQARPFLYKLYCHTTLEVKSGNKLEYWMRDVDNKNKQEKILQQANKGVSYSDLDTDLKRSMNCYCRSNTKYPEFAKQIKELRPDWFDEKQRAKLQQERCIGKKSEGFVIVNKNTKETFSNFLDAGKKAYPDRKPVQAAKSIRRLVNQENSDWEMIPAPTVKDCNGKTFFNIKDAAIKNFPTKSLLAGTRQVRKLCKDPESGWEKIDYV